MIRRLGSVALATALLAACGTVETALQSIGLGVTVQPESDDSLPAALTDTAMQAELPTSAPASAEPPRPRRKPNFAAATARELDPKVLVGMDFAATEALLGAPALQREEPPAKIWAYNGGSCRLNVFFYPSVGDNVFRVLTYEVMGGDIKQGAGSADAATGADISGKDSPQIRRCFADLVHGREASNAG